MKNNLLRMFSAVFPLFLLVGLAAGQGSGPVAPMGFRSVEWGPGPAGDIGQAEDNA